MDNGRAYVGKHADCTVAKDTMSKLWVSSCDYQAGFGGYARQHRAAAAVQLENLITGYRAADGDGGNAADTGEVHFPVEGRTKDYGPGIVVRCVLPVRRRLTVHMVVNRITFLRLDLPQVTHTVIIDMSTDGGR